MEAEVEAEGDTGTEVETEVETELPRETVEEDVAKGPVTGTEADTGMQEVEEEGVTAEKEFTTPESDFQRSFIGPYCHRDRGSGPSSPHNYGAGTTMRPPQRR